MKTKLKNNWKVLAIVCNQWGDTGKGKFVDRFAEEADIIARGTGGANAGHTIKVDGRELIVHLVPSGILHRGKMNIIGNGMVLDPRTLCEELDMLRRLKIDVNRRLMIAHNTKLVLPQHLVMDRLSESSVGKTKIGTTGRGIGPAYIDHVGRVGLTVNDLLNPDLLAHKLRRNLQDKIRLLKTLDPELVRTVMRHEHLEQGRFWSARNMFDVDEIVGALLSYGKVLAPMIKDADAYLEKALRAGKRILLEGAQGTHLSIDYGTYPFVTSSDCTIEGMAKGVGLHTGDIDQVLGIVKAPYMTRVGEGSFPTEMGGWISAHWCASGVKKADELEKWPSLNLTNTMSDYELGIAIRRAGDEFGATTGRPRRTGWLDLPLLRHAVRINGPDVILTKLDVMDTCPVIKICVGYRYSGPNRRIGDRTLRAGSPLSVAIPADEILAHCTPVYKEFEGWQTDISGAKTVASLPPKLRKILRFIATEAKVNIKVLSVGADRNQTIFT